MHCARAWTTCGPMGAAEATCEGRGERRWVLAFRRRGAREATFGRRTCDCAGFRAVKRCEVKSDTHVIDAMGDARTGGWDKENCLLN